MEELKKLFNDFYLKTNGRDLTDDEKKEFEKIKQMEEFYLQYEIDKQDRDCNNIEIENTRRDDVE